MMGRTVLRAEISRLAGGLAGCGRRTQDGLQGGKGECEGAKKLSAGGWSEEDGGGQVRARTEGVLLQRCGLAGQEQGARRCRQVQAGACAGGGILGRRVRGLFSLQSGGCTGCQVLPRCGIPALRHENWPGLQDDCRTVQASNTASLDHSGHWETEVYGLPS